MITEKLGDRNAFAQWFGRYSSTPKYPDIDWKPEQPVTVAELREIIVDGQHLTRNPATRFSFIRQEDGSVLLFVDGGCFECAGEIAAFAEILCAQVQLTVGIELVKSETAMTLIAELISQGSLAHEVDD